MSNWKCECGEVLNGHTAHYHRCDGKPDSEPKPRREGKTRLHGRPLDDDGAIELAVERVQPEPAKPAELTHFRGSYLCRNCGVQSGFHGQFGECPKTDAELEENVKRAKLSRGDGVSPPPEPVPSTSVEPQVEPSRKRKSPHGSTEICLLCRCSLTGDKTCNFNCACHDGVASDSVSHPPLEQEAREWLIAYWKLSPEMAAGSSYEGPIRETAKMLAAFVRERSRP